MLLFIVVSALNYTVASSQACYFRLKQTKNMAISKNITIGIQTGGGQTYKHDRGVSR